MVSPRPAVDRGLLRCGQNPNVGCCSSSKLRRIFDPEHQGDSCLPVRQPRCHWHGCGGHCAGHWTLQESAECKLENGFSGSIRRRVFERGGYLPARLRDGLDGWSSSWKTEKPGKTALFFLPYVAICDQSTQYNLSNSAKGDPDQR